MKFDHRLNYLSRCLLLMVAAIGANLAVGALVRNALRWPLYLDSIGTILVGALLGPLAGAVTGAVSNLLWGALLGEPSILPYTITAAFIGWAAGFAVAHGAFRRISTVVLSGFLVGLGAALVSAPITAYLFGDVTGTGADYLMSQFAATGANLLQAATIQGIISDPLDKIISFVAAWLLWRVLRPYFGALSQRGAGPLESIQGYSVAVAASLLAALLSFVFLPAFERGIFHVFYLAVLISAWRGGLGPALFTTAVGVLCNILFLLSPYYHTRITAEDVLRVGVFVVVSLAIAAIADQLEKSRRALRQSLQMEREARARIRAITDGVDEALMLVSPDQHILDVNQRYCELFGVPRARIAGQRLEDTRTLFDQIFTDAETLYELTLATSADTQDEHKRFVTQNWPQARELQLFSTPVRDAEGFLGRLFVFRDVTREREVDRMKTEFVSLASHELRTPLTSIKGFTQMVLDGDAGEVNEEMQEYLGIVLSNADRLVTLVNDLLDISRIESGRVQLKSEAVDLDEIVGTVVATMQQKIKEKGQTLTVDVEPAATSAVGDKDKLVQVLTNYVSNAHKYTQEGGEIRVVIKKQDEFAHVAVSDNGYGIAPEDQARLFTRFYRVDNAMTRSVGGTGLGLSIVKQLIELQGGQVGMQSVLGAGSTFWFTVPLAPEVDAAAPPVAIPEAEGATPGTPAQTILVIEDDAEVARLIAHHLQKAGYAVRTARSVDDALTSLAAELPDLITLDVDLHDGQGGELVKRLQADPLTSDIPVLVLSVLTDDLADMQLGAYALPKPVDEQQLIGTVARMLQDAQPGPVLVVDDDADVRTLLEAALRQQGFEVETAADGESGLVLANARRPGLILLDMRMPKMDGFAVLRSLKASQATADIPVVAMTGHADPKSSARAQALALGASDFITKPFDINMLVEEIRIFLAAP
jgi:PAS domain S-box-containing protein